MMVTVSSVHVDSVFRSGHTQALEPVEKGGGVVDVDHCWSVVFVVSFVVVGQQLLLSDIVRLCNLVSMLWRIFQQQNV